MWLPVSSYPQTYHTDEAILKDEKQSVVNSAIKNRYLKFDEVLNAKVNIPFAGQYLLGGKLSHLNRHRGVCDAVELLIHDPKAVVLEQGASIDTESLIPTAVRVKPYNEQEMMEYAMSLENPMKYERDFKYLQAKDIPWKKLLSKAYDNAYAKKEYNKDYTIIITT